jgi:uncharacterized Ntn-hydrolase superfamily protein
VIELNTFSIAARCPRTGDFGVAVATARPAVGSIVPWASRRGAIATQARSNSELGRLGLALVDAGVPVAVALGGLVAADPEATHRQLHGVDRHGVFVHTGSDCQPWCGHQASADCTVAGNLLAGPQVIQAMTDAFGAWPEEELAGRLLSALEAGQAAGGDKRGKQSAALLVASEDPRPYHNLRVDDHADPVAELRRLFALTASFTETLREQYGVDGLRRYRQVKP